MNIPLLQVKNLSFETSGHQLLSEISFTLDKGETLVIVGPNGAGKSTLLRCLDGLLRASSGHVLLGGKELAFLGRDELARHIAYLPQSTVGPLPFRVYDFVNMARYAWHGAPGASSDCKAVQDALNLTGCQALESRILEELSGGERQRVFLAAALAQESELLLLDEPSSFLDPRSAAEIRKLLLEIRQERKLALIWVSHDLNDAVLAEGQVLALSGGKIFFYGPVENFMQRDVLEKLFDCRFHLVKHPITGQQMVLPGESTP